MSPVLILGGLALLYLFFKSPIGAQVSCGNPPFCKPSYTPPTLGVAPEWMNAPDLNRRIRFFIDPTTGCMIQNSPQQLQRVVAYVTLLDPKQIETFRCVNGLRAPSLGEGIGSLGGVGASGTLTLEQLIETQYGSGVGCGCRQEPTVAPPSEAVVAASRGTASRWGGSVTKAGTSDGRLALLGFFTAGLENTGPYKVNP